MTFFKTHLDEFGPLCGWQIGEAHSGEKGKKTVRREGIRTKHLDQSPLSGSVGTA